MNILKRGKAEIRIIDEDEEDRGRRDK